MLMRRFPSSLAGRTGHLLGMPYRTGLTSGRGGDWTLESVFRVTAELRHSIYIGAEGEVGGLVSAAPAAIDIAAGTPELTQQHGVVYGAAAVGGVRTLIGPAVLSVELAVGGRGVAHSFAASVMGQRHSYDLSSAELVVEPRVRAEVWLSPFASTGVTVGANTIELGDWMAGLYLGLHTRAFGGHAN